MNRAQIEPPIKEETPLMVSIGMTLIPIGVMLSFISIMLFVLTFGMIENFEKLEEPTQTQIEFLTQMKQFHEIASVGSIIGPLMVIGSLMLVLLPRVAGDEE